MLRGALNQLPEKSKKKIGALWVHRYVSLDDEKQDFVHRRGRAANNIRGIEGVPRVTSVSNKMERRPEMEQAIQDLPTFRRHGR